MKLKLFDHCTIAIHKRGTNIVGVLLALSFISLAASGLHTITLIFLILAGFCAFFFRDPERVIPNKSNIVVSPADGKIVSITQSELPEELKLNDNTPFTKISIFLNVDDVHVQRSPIAADVEKIEYIAGAFINASLDKASKDNERSIMLLKTAKGDKIAVVQIAGLVARRIVSNVKMGDKLNMGDRYGIIKFGSRVDIYLPQSYKIEILPGQYMIGGETIIATF